METVALRIEHTGAAHAERFDQRELHKRFDGRRLIFVGAVDDMHVFLVGSNDPSVDAHVNEATSTIDVLCYGDVYAIGSDAHGEACDVDVRSLSSRLCLRLQNDPPP